MSKDMWFAEMERLMWQYIDEGMGDDEAYERASNEAGAAATERIADMIDRARDEAKYKDIK